MTTENLYGEIIEVYEKVANGDYTFGAFHKALVLRMLRKALTKNIESSTLLKRVQLQIMKAEEQR